MSLSAASAKPVARHNVARVASDLWTVMTDIRREFLHIEAGRPSMLNYRNLIVGIALSASLATAASAQSGGAKVGVLTCKTSASIGLIIGSHQRLRCSF